MRAAVPAIAYSDDDDDNDVNNNGKAELLDGRVLRGVRPLPPPPPAAVKKVRTGRASAQRVLRSIFDG